MKSTGLYKNDFPILTYYLRSVWIPLILLKTYYGNKIFFNDE